MEVTLKAGEPLENVPRSAAEQGFTVLETKQLHDDTYQVTIQK
ncbi:MAG TPA: sulfurtransferase TusA family protein [Bacteroidales bacterium]|nr:sulfurtransferase TusA family protein [Bacteroidales bacterium]